MEVYIRYRQKIVRKRTEFDLRKAEAREHIVKGLLIALKNLNAVIETIKKSRTTPDASIALQKKFRLTKILSIGLLISLTSECEQSQKQIIPTKTQQYQKKEEEKKEQPWYTSLKEHLKEKGYNLKK